MKLSYKKRIFFGFLLIFAVFSVCVILVEQNEEKRYRVQALEARLDSYADLIHGYMVENNLNDTTIGRLHGLVDILPPDIRVTIIHPDGSVIFDQEVDDISKLDNHLGRPEIFQAQYQDHGSHIRMSASMGQESVYYAKSYKEGFVRVALPYNTHTQNMVEADNIFIYIVVGLFVLVLLLLNYVAGRFSRSISKLKTFSVLIRKDRPLPDNIVFPHDELGDIGRELVDIFKEKERSKQEVIREREKLIRHFRFSEEGIGIFKSDFKQVYFNTHFVQYLNLILDKPSFDIDSMFGEEIFKQIKTFVEDKSRPRNHFTYQVNKSGKCFSVNTIIYEDGSFEVNIKDVTQLEKTRLIKQEMTNNIAHELRTPVTSLRGYLETLKEKDLPKEKQTLFIDRAYIQSLRLSNLIEDVSLLSKIEEAPSRFVMEKIDLLQLINEVRIDLTDKLNENHIKLFVSVPDDLSIQGNHTLVYSIFRNLIDNSISYAGQNAEIHIDNYMTDDKFVYFSYYDTGKGVEEQHLNRLFERFYRVNEGRTRDTGGSGLGLSIVRNAIQIHKGTIQAKNRIEGGLEFLFTLRR